MNEENYIKIIENQNKQIEQYKKEIDILKQKLEYYINESKIDSLTKLKNRRAIDGSDNYDSIIMGDIDYFKKINDKYGHDIGDEVLIAISKIFRQYINDSDLVCRWGGEEFVIFLKDCSDIDAYNKALLLKDKISELSKKFGFEITMSFGISNNLIDKTLKSAINEADQAMYKSKQDGRDRVTVYSLK